MRLVRSIYFNAVQLFLDASTLYRCGSFPTAYALAILAYEELGKMEMVDHVGFEEVLNGSPHMTRERMEHLFSRTMFYSHRNKQAWGTYRHAKEGRVPKAEQRIYDGRLESDKQNAFYVGFIDGRIQHPAKFTAFHAYKQLRYALGAFEVIADMPFYDVTQESSGATRRYAKSVTDTLREAFESCTPPSKHRCSTQALSVT
jgi:AbiV family abortive infection protein